MSDKAKIVTVEVDRKPGFMRRQRDAVKIAERYRQLYESNVFILTRLESREAYEDTWDRRTQENRFIEELSLAEEQVRQLRDDLSNARMANRTWRCFHCEFTTSDEAEAQAHFGDRDDAEEFTPICKWWAEMDDTARKHQFQDLQKSLTRTQEHEADLEEQVRKLEEALTRYKTVRDAFGVEGTAEEALAATEPKEKDGEPKEQA